MLPQDRQAVRSLHNMHGTDADHYPGAGAGDLRTATGSQISEGYEIALYTVRFSGRGVHLVNFDTISADAT